MRVETAASRRNDAAFRQAPDALEGRDHRARRTTPGLRNRLKARLESADMGLPGGGGRSGAGGTGIEVEEPVINPRVKAVPPSCTGWRPHRPVLGPPQ